MPSGKMSKGYAFSQAKARAESEQKEIFVIYDVSERSYYAQDCPACTPLERDIGSVKPSMRN